MKKNNRQRYLAILTFIALAILLVVQVYWLFKIARLEEENFNQQVNKALTEARKEIGKTLDHCDDMKNYLCGMPCLHSVREKKIAELDSIINSKLEIYHINLKYTFNITDSIAGHNSSKLFGSKCYLQSLNGLLQKDGIQIRLQFPDRNQFLIAQLRGAFLLAFGAVLFVIFSFIITFSMFSKERKMAQQTSDFINNMVHELQTPLANIRLATSLIRKKEKSINDEKVIEYISVIQNENLKLEKHVDDILKVASSANNHHHSETVDVHQLITSTAQEFKTRIEGENGKIELNLEASAFVINAAPDLIKLILSNLIDNAIKYTVKRPHIIISTINKNDELVVKVKDNGIGIDKKDITNIFDKYFRVSTGDVHNVKGFGLGLTFVKKIVEQYKGKIEVESSKTSGTLFTIHLPLKNEKD
jgi:two-component system, OmpR family, phosphate regulon sensor histidine kinase PhoR